MRLSWKKEASQRSQTCLEFNRRRQDCLRFHNRERKSGSCPDRGFHPDRAPQPFNDLLADRQTETATVDIPICKAYERHEYTSLVLLRNAEAVVLDSDDPVWSTLLGTHVNFDRVLTPIFHRVTNQVLE